MTDGGILISLIAGAAIPTVVHGVTFAVMRRYLSGDPMKIIKANVVAFGVHLVVYGVIIVAVVSWMNLRFLPFVFSFAGFFLLLHISEAVYFKRLLLNRQTRRNIS
ncbi:MAG: hypothetical protein ACE5LH_08465 [Fidelibacterota bacterium]